jgi:hypothetical protein
MEKEEIKKIALRFDERAYDLLLFYPLFTSEESFSIYKNLIYSSVLFYACEEYERSKENLMRALEYLNSCKESNLRLYYEVWFIYFFVDICDEKLGIKPTTFHKIKEKNQKFTKNNKKYLYQVSIPKYLEYHPSIQSDLYEKITKEIDKWYDPNNDDDGFFSFF